MKEREVLFGLHEIPGIGWKTIMRIVGSAPTLMDCVGQPPAYFEQLGLLPSKAAILSEKLTWSWIQTRLHLYEETGANFLTIGDDEYPFRLLHSGQPPWVIYYKGNIEVLKKPLLGVVGTRTPTAYGRNVTESFSRQLSEVGMVIVSGMARGIDTASHKGALEGGSGTVAVLASSIDAIYPPENTSLYNRIASEGLILTETPIGTHLQPGLFPMRNRIIAGISLGVLVVEAAEKSGSLITADMALEDSREVFAVPGLITSPKSSGTLNLLKEGGAKLVTRIEDILEDFPLEKFNVSAASKSASVGGKINTILTNEEQLVYDLIHSEVLTFDTLLERSQFTFGLLHSVLLSLVLKNKVKPLPGSSYTSI